MLKRPLDVIIAWLFRFVLAVLNYEKSLQEGDASILAKMPPTLQAIAVAFYEEKQLGLNSCGRPTDLDLV